MSRRDQQLDMVATIIADGMDDGHHADDIAKIVVDAVLPQITDAAQMAHVPELALLTTETRPVATIYQWRDGCLHEDTDSKDLGFFPASVLIDEGPLTVVWQP